MTVLQTKDGHIDIVGDLLSEENEMPQRFTDKIGRNFYQNGYISEMIFSAEFIHVEFKYSIRLPNGRSKEENKVYRFNANY